MNIRLLMFFHSYTAHFFSVLKCFIVCMHPSSFIHSPTEEYLGCFQVWAIMNKATINNYVQIFVWTYIFPSFG